MGPRPQRLRTAIALVCFVVALVCFVVAAGLAALSLLFAVAAGREYGPDQGIQPAVIGLGLAVLIAWAGSRLLKRARRP